MKKAGEELLDNQGKVSLQQTNCQSVSSSEMLSSELELERLLQEKETQMEKLREKPLSI